MFKRFSMFYIILASVFLLGACSENEAVEKQQIQEDVNTLSIKDARQVTEDLYEEIMASMTSYFEDNQITPEIASSEEINTLLEQMKRYATDTMIEEELRFIAENYCLGCDAYLFEFLMSSGNFIRGEVEQVSQNEIKMTNFSHPDIAFGGEPYKHISTLTYEENTWKLVRYEVEHVSLNLTEEEALLVAKNYLIENPEIIGTETNEQGDKVYIISTATSTMRINANSGMEEYVEEAPTQSIEETNTDDPLAAKTPKGQVVDLQTAFDVATKEVSAIYDSSDDYEMFVANDEKVMVVWDTFIADAIETVKETMPDKANAIEADYEAYLAGYDAAVFEESGGVGMYNSETSAAIVYVKRSFAEDLLNTYGQ